MVFNDLIERFFMPFPSILNFLIARLPLLLTVNLTPFLFTSLPVLIVNRAPYVSAFWLARNAEVDTLATEIAAFRVASTALANFMGTLLTNFIVL